MTNNLKSFVLSNVFHLKGNTSDLESVVNQDNLNHQSSTRDQIVCCNDHNNKKSISVTDSQIITAKYMIKG